MPNRILKESICTSDTIEELTLEEEIFFYRLIVTCDDYGRMDARPSILRARCFPLRIDRVKDYDVEFWLHKFHSVGLITLYQVEDRPYLQMKTWNDHQQIRAHKSKYPAPDINGNQMISGDIKCYRNPIQSESKSESESESKNNMCADAHASDSQPEGAQSKIVAGKGKDKAPAGKSGEEYTQEFEEFWSLYPRRIEKKAAYKAWNARLNEKEHYDNMISAARNYALHCQDHCTEDRFIKHAKTFLGPSKPYQEFVNGAPLIASNPGKKIPRAFQSLRDWAEGE
ncbi:hypothetical protein BHU72_11880 [Desulfuribacillus stibiiarsenatis]|uniref:Uncharacterized protein n=1 Tax=Desulfuribacillus stibiiarsenatis TaxID=1390249 RepID=A0A1E5L842_9FIRM|nr:hypothetical protein [Desulfuribacillus stibiiarsenatis]OEH86228.1 hypothetical protein BHU72_11880 [Desulfuribacillus stibiiarsenatis]